MKKTLLTLIALTLAGLLVGAASAQITMGGTASLTIGGGGGSSGSSVLAANYPGADCGAKVNAADTAWLGTPVEIDVTQACGTTWTTPVTITANHNLKFTQGGTYVLPGGNLLKGVNVISGTGDSTILELQNSDADGLMFDTTDGLTFASSDITFRSIELNGNSANQSVTGAHIGLIYVGGTGTISSSNITLNHVTMTNCMSICLLSFTPVSTAVTFISDVNVLDSVFSNSGAQAIANEGVNYLTVRNTQISNWGLTNTGVAAISASGQSTTGGAYQYSYGYQITNNTLTGGTSQEFSIEFYGAGQGAGFYAANISGNTLIGDTDGTCHNGFSMSLVASTVQFNRFIQPGAAAISAICSRGGLYEQTTANSTISNNIIKGGILSITGGSNDVAGTNNIFETIIADNYVETGPVANVAAMDVNGGSTNQQNKIKIHDNLLNITGATGSCKGLLTGVAGGSPSIVNNLFFDHNYIYDNGNTEVCEGVHLAGADGSSGARILHNEFYGLASAFRNQAEPTVGTTDVDFENNIARNVTSLISSSSSGTGIVRQWGNSTAATDTTQHLNGGADIAVSGQVVAPSGIANGNLVAPPASGLIAWYPAASTCTVDGTTPTTLTDASGNGVTLTGTGATCKLSIINSQPVFRFAGTGTGYVGTFSLTPATVFVVERKTVGAGANTFLFDNKTGNAYGAMFYSAATTLKAQATTNFTATVPDDNNFHVATDAEATNGPATLYFDGAQVATGAIGAWNGLQGITVAARADGSSPFNGDIAEVLVYNSVLTTTQIQSVGAYIASKYALTQAGTWSVVGGTANFGTSVTTPSVIDTSLAPGTLPVCPNGTLNALTTVGCAGGASAGANSNITSLSGLTTPLSPAQGGIGNFTGGASAWLRFFGDGSDGALNCTSGTCNISSEKWYSSVNISVGATVATNASQNPTIIRSTGTCTIAGTLSVSPNTDGGLGLSGVSGEGGSGGGGGGGTAAGVAGSGNNLAAGGTLGASSGGSGGNGNTTGLTIFRMLLSAGTPWQYGPAAGNFGGAQGGAGGSSGPSGGKGGQLLVLVCPTINFTGTIDASGGTGGNSTGNTIGSSGGGGGGIIITSAITYTAYTGTINKAGGAGGSCGAFTTCGAGGTGGTGSSYQATIQ